MRWADLRLTCAASMALGVWGHRYSVTHIQRMLGISNVYAMQRYSTLFESELGGAGSALAPQDRPQVKGSDGDESGSVLHAHVISAAVLRAERAEIAHSSERATADADDMPGSGVALVAEPRAWRAKGGVNSRRADDRSVRGGARVDPGHPRPRRGSTLHGQALCRSLGRPVPARRNSPTPSSTPQSRRAIAPAPTLQRRRPLDDVRHDRRILRPAKRATSVSSGGAPPSHRELQVVGDR